MEKCNRTFRNRIRLRGKWILLVISLMGSLFIAVGFITTSKAGAESLTPSASDTFVDSVGIVSQLGYTETPYAQNWRKADPSQDVRAIFADLGIRHVRDRIAHPTLQLGIAYTRPRVAQLYRDKVSN